MQLVIFILEHLIYWRKVNRLSRAKRKRFGQSLLLLYVILARFYGTPQFLLIFLLHYNLILTFIQQRNPYFLLLLMIITPIFLLLLFFLLLTMDLRYQRPQIFMNRCLRVDALDVYSLLLILLKVLIDNFLHIVVLLRPIKINLMLPVNLNSLPVSLPCILILYLTLMTHNSGIKGQVDRLKAFGCVAIKLTLHEMLTRLYICKMGVDMMIGMMLVSTHF